MSFPTTEGEPLLEIILGATPASNKLAIRHIKAVGFVAIGEIPRMLPNILTGGRDAAVISYYLRN